MLFQCPSLSLAKVLVSNSNTAQQKLTLFEVCSGVLTLEICYIWPGPAACKREGVGEGEREGGKERRTAVYIII